MSFAAYQAWYADRLTRRRATVRGYWRRQLRDVPPLDLPADVLAPSRTSGRGQRLRLEIAGDTTTAIQAAARAHHTSSFAILLGTWTALLFRLSGSRRITVGVASAGQSAMGKDTLVG